MRKMSTEEMEKKLQMSDEEFKKELDAMRSKHIEETKKLRKELQLQKKRERDQLAKQIGEMVMEFFSDEITTENYVKKVDELTKSYLHEQSLKMSEEDVEYYREIGLLNEQSFAPTENIPEAPLWGENETVQA